jgi:uncharacterized protein YbjT (DUF2867 family)
MKIVVIGGTGLIGSKLVALLRHAARKYSRLHRIRASIHSREKVCQKPSPARKWSSISRTPRRLKTQRS